MRRNTESQGISKAGDDGRPVGRSGVLLASEQRPPGDASQAEAAEALRFLVHFTRELIRNNPSQDILFLSMSAAAKRANLTQDQAKKFIAWVLEEKSNSPWPDGFFA